MDDVISRNLCDSCINNGCIFQSGIVRNHCDFYKAGIAERKTGQWIPCSERMPDEHEWLGTKKFGTTISNEVYVTFEAPDGQRFAEHINFQNGKLSPVDEQRMKVWFKGAKPIAWMPLPEPYMEEEK